MSFTDITNSIVLYLRTILKKISEDYKLNYSELETKYALELTMGSLKKTRTTTKVNPWIAFRTEQLKVIKETHPELSYNQQLELIKQGWEKIKNNNDVNEKYVKIAKESKDEKIQNTKIIAKVNTQNTKNALKSELCQAITNKGEQCSRKHNKDYFPYCGRHKNKCENYYNPPSKLEIIVEDNDEIQSVVSEPFVDDDGNTYYIDNITDNVYHKNSDGDQCEAKLIGKMVNGSLLKNQLTV